MRLGRGLVGTNIEICIMFRSCLHETGTKSNPGDFVLVIIVFIYQMFAV